MALNQKEVLQTRLQSQKEVLQSRLQFRLFPRRRYFNPGFDSGFKTRGKCFIQTLNQKEVLRSSACPGSEAERSGPQGMNRMPAGEAILFMLCEISLVHRKLMG